MTTRPHAWAALRRHPFVAACAALLVALSSRLVVELARLSKRLRAHGVSALRSAVVATSSACLAGVLAVSSNVPRHRRVPDLCVGFGPILPSRLVGALALGSKAVRSNFVYVSCRALVATLWSCLVGAFSLAWTAVLRHPLSVACTALLVTATAGLLGIAVPLAVLLWALASLTSLETWRGLEPFVLARLGCRLPSHLERERLDPALGADRIQILIFDAAEPWLGRGVRTLVLSRALLDLLEDRALAGLLAQAREQVRAANVAGALIVWSGNLPLLTAWWLSRFLVQLGRLLAVFVGASLVVPMVLWPSGFARWAGGLFGAVIVGLLGAILLSSGVSAAGLGLLLAWALVPGLRALLNWETRQAERVADDATLTAGLGWELIEALETLAWAASVPPPPAPLGWLCQLASPLTTRADRLRQKLSQP